MHSGTQFTWGKYIKNTTILRRFFFILLMIFQTTYKYVKNVIKIGEKLGKIEPPEHEYQFSGMYPINCITSTIIELLITQ